MTNITNDIRTTSCQHEWLSDELNLNPKEQCGKCFVTRYKPNRINNLNKEILA